MVARDRAVSTLDSSPGSTAFSIATTWARLSRVPRRTRIWSPLASGLSCSQKIRARIRRVSRGLAPVCAMTSPRSMNNSRSSVMPTDGRPRAAAVDRRHRPPLDGLDLRDLAGGHDDDFVTRHEVSGLNAAGDDAAIVELVDGLHRQAQRQLFQQPRRFEPIERLDTFGPRTSRSCVRRQRRRRHARKSGSPPAGSRRDR